MYVNLPLVLEDVGYIYMVYIMLNIYYDLNKYVFTVNCESYDELYFHLVTYYWYM